MRKQSSTVEDSSSGHRHHTPASFLYYSRQSLMHNRRVARKFDLVLDRPYWSFRILSVTSSLDQFSGQSQSSGAAVLYSYGSSCNTFSHDWNKRAFMTAWTSRITPPSSIQSISFFSERVLPHIIGLPVQLRSVTATTRKHLYDVALRQDNNASKCTTYVLSSHYPTPVIVRSDV